MTLQKIARIVVNCYTILRVSQLILYVISFIRFALRGLLHWNTQTYLGVKNIIEDKIVRVNKNKFLRERETERSTKNGKIKEKM